MWAQEGYGLSKRDDTVAVPGGGNGFLAARDVTSHLVQPPAHSGAGGPVRNSEAEPGRARGVGERPGGRGGGDMGFGAFRSAGAPLNGVTPLVGDQAGSLCEVCGKPRSPKSDFWCSRRCKDTAYNRAHPVTRQARLDFTPAASELAHAVRGRETKANRILARLRIASATSIELAKITHRFSARIYELRKAGHRITREDCVHDGQEWSVYMLEGGA